MLSGEFERKLRNLNKRIRIYCGNNDLYAAGIYVVSPAGEYTEICAADKNYVPEFIMYDSTGRIQKSGWRRILKILISKGLVKKQEAQKEFGTRLDGRSPTRPKIQQDSALKKLANMGIEIVSSGGF
jgi:hypothetical protein